MRNEATGALIAVIGDDNDDFVLIGTRRDLSLKGRRTFLGVNEGDLAETMVLMCCSRAEAGATAA